MKKVDLDLTVEGDISGFLGINIQYHKDGTVHLTQPHLIDSILRNLASKPTMPRPSPHQQHPASYSATTMMHPLIMRVFITGVSLASSTTLRKAPKSPMPCTNVPTFL